jgi:hypothetical protein
MTKTGGDKIVFSRKSFINAFWFESEILDG